MPSTHNLPSTEPSLQARLTGSRNRATCLLVAIVAWAGWCSVRSPGLRSDPHEKVKGIPSFQANINLADAMELQLLPGIGPKSAEEILRVRLRDGGFQVIQDLDRVDGIGKKTIEQLKAVVVLDSHPFPGSSPDENDSGIDHPTSLHVPKRP